MTETTTPETVVQNKKDYGNLVNALQIIAVIFMAAMTVFCVVIVKKYDISIKDINASRAMISGSILAVAVGVILFSVVKSFVFVFSVRRYLCDMRNIF